MRSVLCPFFGVEWTECLSPTFKGSAGAPITGLGIFDIKCFLVGFELLLDVMLKGDITASESAVAMQFLSWEGWNTVLLVRSSTDLPVQDLSFIFT
mmetsp:Transcript_6714/g.10938  ORF Transcript_6714/g.10938 Transcript_6714/m.10938 type:complete len:96 (-) Transcript_6714:149-436(-)